MKLTRVLGILTLVVLTGSSLIGCATTNQQAKTPASDQAAKTEQTQAQKASQAASDIKVGVTKMLAVTTDLKNALADGNEPKVKSAAPQLEDAWSPFEDKVKEQYPEMYKKVEDSLDPLMAGAKASPLDKQTVGKLNDQLMQALNELAGKVK